MACRYSYVDKGDGRVRPWDPGRLDLAPTPDFNYHGAVVREAVEILGDPDLHFVLTWDADSVPDRGQDVVVILLGDEWSSRPSYSSEVLAVFRSMCGQPFWPFPEAGGSAVARFVERVKLARNTLREAGRRIRHGRTPDVGNVFEIPLGTYKLQDVPFVPWPDRTTDVFFRGELQDDASWLRPGTMTPKNIARSAMARAVSQFKQRRPDLTIDCGVYSGFAAMSEPDVYSRQLMASRIALSPRGSHPETFRSFECAKFGCVVVTNPLPPTPHYRNHPFVVIQDWSRLPQVLDGLLADPVALEARHRQTLTWWETTASPQAVGRLMAEAVRSRMAV
jgi:hypothetical protein